MGMHSPELLIEAGETEKLPLDKLSLIKICWSPGKKGNSQDLEQAVFSVRDTVMTRKMLATTPILTRRAAECIIDFCPDLLWRDILLRILSEASYSNKEIRDRFCLNGSWSDRATIAKRLGAALEVADTRFLRQRVGVGCADDGPRLRGGEGAQTDAVRQVGVEPAEAPLLEPL